MPEWPADKVERWSIERLLPYARNARLHSDAQVAQIAASIREYGWTVPVLVDEEGTLIAGHGRVLAARQLGIDTVPTMSATGWSEAKRRAYRIADNKLALNALWDDELLTAEFTDLKGMDFDLSLTGFSNAEVDQFLSPELDPNDEWEGMPEFEQKDKTAFQTIAVHLKDQEAVDAFAELIGQRITRRTRFIWYPQTEIETYADKRYVA